MLNKERGGVRSLQLFCFFVFALEGLKSKRGSSTCTPSHQALPSSRSSSLFTWVPFLAPRRPHRTDHCSAHTLTLRGGETPYVLFSVGEPHVSSVPFVSPRCHGTPSTGAPSSATSLANQPARRTATTPCPSPTASKTIISAL